MSKILQNLLDLGISLPAPNAPVANYVGYTIHNSTVFISGQLPIVNGELKYIGKVGVEISIEDATRAARICAINIISQLNLACNGNLDKVVRCLKLVVFINADSNFKDHPMVANGASDLMVEIFGEAGKHSRAAIGCSSLPRGVSVEIDAVFAINS